MQTKNKLYFCQKLKVIGIGLETFAKLIANGVFPGSFFYYYLLSFIFFKFIFNVYY